MASAFACRVLAVEKLSKKEETKAAKTSPLKYIKNKQRSKIFMVKFTTIIVKKNFPKEIRLRKHYGFLSIQRLGVRLRTSNLIFIVRPAFRLPRTPKIGFTVTKKVGKANVRNLIKRRLRHLSRENFVHWKKYQIVVLAKPSSAVASFIELKFDFFHALNQAAKKLRNKHSIKSKHN